jgi:DNA-binding NarL/FixJ family response regulator
MTKEQVTELNCKKHIKIYKLKQLGLSNKEIAESLKTNTGHVYNALKKYDANDKLKTDADLL